MPDQNMNSAAALANQSDNSRDLDTRIREKRLESKETQLDAMETEFETERRMNRVDAIENLEGLRHAARASSDARFLRLSDVRLRQLSSSCHLCGSEGSQEQQLNRTKGGREVAFSHAIFHG